MARSWEEVPLAGRVVCSPLAEDDTVTRSAWVRVDEAHWVQGEAHADMAGGPTALRALADRLLAMITRRAPRRRRAER